jgi:TolB-like protein
MIASCERPIMFELTQTADLSHWQGGAEDPVWLAFLDDVKRVVTKGATSALTHGAHLATLPVPAPAASARDERPSLAVMPFTNRSGLPEDDALAYGMVEDIVSAASLSRDIRVLASSSTRAWADKAADLRDVGRERGVRYVLEGNVRRTGQNLRVTVQLVEAESGVILWTQKFDRPLSELADLQEALVTEMAAQLGVEVVNREFERVLRKPGDITAYEAVQRAHAVYGRLSLDRLPFAIAEARRAVALSPDYGEANGELALSLGAQFFWTGGDNHAAAREALHYARRAVDLAGSDPKVLSRAAFAMAYLDQPLEALRHALRALDLNPNVADVHRCLAIIYLRLGRNDEAVASYDSAERLAPGHAAFYVSCMRQAQAHFQAGRLEKATEVMERAFRLNPDYAPTLVLRAGLCSLAGRTADAIECICALQALEPDTSVDLHASRMLARGEVGQSAGLIAAFRKVWAEARSE